MSLQGCLSCRKPTDGERYIYVGDDKTDEVHAIGKFRLLLKIGFYLVWKFNLLWYRLLVEVQAIGNFFVEVQAIGKIHLLLYRLLDEI